MTGSKSSRTDRAPRGNQRSSSGIDSASSAPDRRLERICEVLRLVRDETVGDLRDADRVCGYAVVADHALAHPEVASARDPADREVALGRVRAPLRLDLRPAAEALPRLRVVEDRVLGIDRVLGVSVPALRRLLVSLDPNPDFGVTISCAAHSSVPLRPVGIVPACRREITRGSRGPSKVRLSPPAGSFG
jgi:hypothetical protein